MTLPVAAARSVTRQMDLATEADDRYHRLMADEAFTVACDRYRKADIYADHEHATNADREARDALKRSVREHAQRVFMEHDK